MTKGCEGEPPVDFSKRLKEKQDLLAQPSKALIQRMWNTLTESQKEALWDDMSDVETVELVENLPDIPKDELSLMAARANRLFIRPLSLPVQKDDSNPLGKE